jgi:Uncharacterized conserved protein
MKPDCSDIRFTYVDTSNNTEVEIPFWVESGMCNRTNTRIWIKVPHIPAYGNAIVFMYYGNPDAISKSNGNAVFEFFDDFDGPEPGKWIYTTGYSYGFDDPGTKYGRGIWFYGDADGKVATRTLRTFSNNIVIESRIWKWTSSSNHFIYISQSPSETWSSSSTPGVIRFAWVGDYKYIYGQSTSTYVSRGVETHYDIRIIITPTHVSFVDWYTTNPLNTNVLSLEDTLDNFYIYIGADETLTGYRSYFYWIAVRKYAPVEPTVIIGQEEDLI